MDVINQWCIIRFCRKRFLFSPIRRKTTYLASKTAPPTSTILLESVPDVAIEVVVATEKEPATLWEGHRRYATDDVVVWVHADLLVGTQVEQPAGRVVRAGRKRVTVRENLQATSHSENYGVSGKCKHGNYTFVHLWKKNWVTFFFTTKYINYCRNQVTV